MDPDLPIRHPRKAAQTVDRPPVTTAPTLGRNRDMAMATKTIRGHRRQISTEI
jgi:hypothetical protein